MMETDPSGSTKVPEISLPASPSLARINVRQSEVKTRELAGDGPTGNEKQVLILEDQLLDTHCNIYCNTRCKTHCNTHC